MSRDWDTILDECLDWREQRAVQVALTQYAQEAPELQPLVSLASDIRQLTAPEPSPEARAMGRERMLTALAQSSRRAGSPVPAGPLTRRTRFPRQFMHVGLGWQMAVVVLLVALAAGGGVMSASSTSLPGDVLYPMKLAVQQAQLDVTIDSTARHDLEEQFSARQRQDVQLAQRSGRQADTQFEGVLEQVEQDEWTVGGVTVMLKADTVVKGQPRVGDWVVVRGHLPGDRTQVATYLEVTNDVPGRSPTARPPASSPPAETQEPAGSPEPAHTPPPRGAATLEPTGTLPAPGEIQPTDTPQPHRTAQPKPTDEPKPTKEPNPTKESKPTKEPKSTKESKP